MQLPLGLRERLYLLQAVKPVVSSLSGAMEEAKASAYLREPSLMNDPNILRYLTRTGSRRALTIMYAVLSELPATARQNVVYFSGDGHVYGTDPTQVAQSYFQTPSPAGTPTPPPDCVNSGAPNTENCTGSFLRHFTSTTKEITQDGMEVSLPCYGSVMHLNSKLTNGYILLGANTFKPGNTVSYANVDAGLQYNNGTDLKPQSFMKVFDPEGLLSSTPTGYTGHWECGQTVTMLFQETSPSLLSLMITGKEENGPTGTATTSYAVHSGEGYSTECGAQPLHTMTCQAKREITFAKPPYLVVPETADSPPLPATYFGVSSPGTLGEQHVVTMTNPGEAGVGAPSLSPWVETEYDECPQATGGTPAIVGTPNGPGTETIGVQSQGFIPPSYYCIVYGSGD